MFVGNFFIIFPNIPGKTITEEKIEILKKVGYLPSESAFYSGMKVKDVLALSAKLRGIDCSEEAKILCERLDLDVSKKVDELSTDKYEQAKYLMLICYVSLEKYESVQPELVTLDIVMPGMDGMETCEAMRKRWPDAKIFMVSSMAYEDMINHAAELGAMGFLFKPFTKESLLEGLRGALKAIAQ